MEIHQPGSRVLAEYAEHIRAGKRAEERWHATCARLTDLGAAAVPAMVQALSRAAYVQVRLLVVEALAELGSLGVPVQHALLQALRDPRARVRRAAVARLIWLGFDPAGTPSLVERLQDDRDDEVRALAARALGPGPPERRVLNALLNALTDPAGRVRAAAAEALGQLGQGDASLGPLLEEHFLLDDQARPSLAVALAQAAPRRLVDLAARAPATFWAGAATWRPGWPCREILLRLAALGPEAAPVRQVFVQMLDTPARLAALHALGRVGAAARDAVAAIARVRGHAAESARRAIGFAGWHEDERLDRADEGRWRERLLARYRQRWQLRPIAPEARREIERLASAEPYAAVLAARVRAHDVARDRVDLAASLGDLASRNVLNWPTFTFPTGKRSRRGKGRSTAGRWRSASDWAKRRHATLSICGSAIVYNAIGGRRRSTRWKGGSWHRESDRRTASGRP